MVIVTTFMIPLLGNTVCADEVGCDWYFDSYLPIDAWENDPENMVDGNPGTFASTSTSGDTQYLNGNEYDEEYEYEITKVWIKVWGKYSGSETDILLTPIRDRVPGDTYRFTPDTSLNYSEWFNITGDWPTQSWWTWEDIEDLECVVMADYNENSFTLYCSQVDIAVWFIV